MSLEYKLEGFEGPLDLLLLLIEKNKVDIFDIPIAEIAEQYMAYVKAMEEENLEIVSDFLVMAATLLDIKARMLLPKEEDENGEEIDPRTELVEKLIEYREYKMMARELQAHYEDTSNRFYRETSLPDEVKHYKPAPDLEELLKDVNAERLRAVFELVIRKREDMKDEIRSEFGTIKKDPVRISDKLQHILTFGKEQKQFSFRDLLKEQHTTQEVVVTFLACLELIKVGQISVSQEEILGDIDLIWNDDCETKLTKEDIEQYD